MAIKVKPSALEGFEDTYRPVDTQAGQPVPIEGLRVRFVSARRRAYWAAKGLKPIKADMKVIQNADYFQRSADGTLRHGEREIWGETESHFQGRAAVAKREREEQESTVAMRQSAGNAVRNASGGEVSGVEDLRGGVELRYTVGEDGLPLPQQSSDVSALREQLEDMQRQIERLTPAAEKPSADGPPIELPDFAK